MKPRSHRHNREVADALEQRERWRELQREFVPRLEIIETPSELEPEEADDAHRR